MKRRVAHVITRLDLGGAQQNTLYCVANHDRDRFDVGLVAGRGGVLDDEAARIRDARVRLLDDLVHPISPVRDAIAVVRLATELRRRRVELVHTHSSKAGILGRWAARMAGVRRVVHTVHGWSFNETQPAPVRGLYRALERAAGAVTDRIVVVCEADRIRGLEARIGRPGRYRLIRSGIDRERWRHPSRPRAQIRRELGFDDAHVVVGTLACLKPQKAPLDFVEAARRAHAVRSDLRFFIAGDGPERARVERHIDEASLDGVVRLLGWRRDAEDLVHAMDVFLLTSRFEGLPRAVLQAMAAGVPVVATSVDGTPEVVHDGETGRLVPPADPAAACERVLELAGDPELRRRLATAARTRLGDEFDLATMLRRLERLYVELLDPVPGTARLEGADGRA